MEEIINIIPSKDISFRTKSKLIDILNRLELSQQDRKDLERYIYFGGGESLKFIKDSLKTFNEYKNKFDDNILDLNEEVNKKLNIEDSPFKKGSGNNSATSKHNKSIATETGALSLGGATTASGMYSAAFNDQCISEGQNASSFGYKSYAIANNSHAEGRETKTTLNAVCSHVEGYKSETGSDSDISISGTFSEGFASHAEGLSTRTWGIASHSEGIGTRANGKASHSEGYNTISEGIYSHAEGQATKASGNYSHSEGNQTDARGQQSHAEGYQTITSNQSEHAEGRFNVSNSSNSINWGLSENTLHSVGMGRSASDRKNAHEIMQDGRHYIYGIGGYNGKNISESTDVATYIKSLETRIAELENIISQITIQVE